MDNQSVYSAQGLDQRQKTSMLKKDLLIAAIIGFFVGLLLLPVISQSTIFKNLNFGFSYALALVIVMPILCLVGMLVALLLAQKIKIIYQAAKFILVGGLNTLLDLGILSLLLSLTGVSQGIFYSVFKGVSFVFAVVNSYFWNKFWTFKKAVPANAEIDKKSAGKEVSQFFVVSLIGFALNVGVASLLVNIWGPHFGISVKPWGLFGAVCGTLTGLVWNFLGYKLVVFKK